MIDYCDRVFCGCSMDCKHVYDKASIMHYIATNPNAKCPIAGKILLTDTYLSCSSSSVLVSDSYGHTWLESSGCRGKLKSNKVVCDPMLKFEIEELRTMNKQSNRDEVIEDFTNADDED